MTFTLIVSKGWPKFCGQEINVCQSGFLEEFKLFGGALDGRRPSYLNGDLQRQTQN